MHRRHFIKQSAAASLAMIAYQDIQSFIQDRDISVQPITQGPKYHWFGYYDKLQFNPTGRYALGMEVDFEHRSPAENDTIKIGMVDLKKGNKWIELGESSAWGWQQGCMLQWIPGSPSEIIWNDREGDNFVSRVLNVKTMVQRTLSKAVYTLSPDGNWAIGTEFFRIQNLRPGYGYAGINDPYDNIKAPKEIGIYKINLKTGEHNLLFSLADIAAITHKGQSVLDNYHWFNHLLINTDGTRFTFLHRWREKIEDRQKMAGSGFITRMFTADTNGKDLFLIDPSGFTSHFIWRDSTHICAFTKPEGQETGFYLLEDKSGKYERLGAKKMPVNGHQTYLPHHNNEWLLNDTYPDKKREQTLYLYHITGDRRIDLGRFFSPDRYKGEWRCDLHPRSSPDGKKIIIDSTHELKGRQMYLINLKNIIG